MGRITDGILHSRDAKVDKSDKIQVGSKHWHHYDTDIVILKPCTHQCVVGSQRYDMLSLLQTMDMFVGMT